MHVRGTVQHIDYRRLLYSNKHGSVCWSHSRLAAEVFVGEEPQPVSSCRSSYRKVAAGIRVCYRAYVLSCATNNRVG